MEVRLNDYLDIVCPHYPEGEVPQLDAERYVLYMVEREDYQSCKPQSYDQMRWECSHPFAPHAPEKFSEKFQRFTPFTLGKEFRQGESYYYICECPSAAAPLIYDSHACKSELSDHPQGHAHRNPAAEVNQIYHRGSRVTS